MAFENYKLSICVAYLHSLQRQFINLRHPQQHHRIKSGINYWEINFTHKGNSPFTDDTSVYSLFRRTQQQDTAKLPLKMTLEIKLVVSTKACEYSSPSQTESGYLHSEVHLSLLGP